MLWLDAEYQFYAQLVHLVALCEPDMPSVDVLLPAAQLVHADWPFAVEIFPAAHASHCRLSPGLEKNPATQ